MFYEASWILNIVGYDILSILLSSDDEPKFNKSFLPGSPSPSFQREGEARAAGSCPGTAAAAPYGGTVPRDTPFNRDNEGPGDGR